MVILGQTLYNNRRLYKYFRDYKRKRGKTMSAKRKPPTLQQKKEEVNKKALVWIGSGIALLIILIIVLIVIAQP
ncbi:lipopolysaccharide/colanic/teichoic acid biosynthesis glycosyltransferase [Paenibacillus sp. LBL]|jgi:lipopolysaccharide/colanic/teichoic acid biosynthesis glycosyltransferase|nr:lipopolysaccharide/colanic/teichoic acid biosynthesis glycosyltransferase [Paenibacillus sp. LBL]